MVVVVLHELPVVMEEIVVVLYVVLVATEEVLEVIYSRWLLVLRWFCWSVRGSSCHLGVCTCF